MSKEGQQNPFSGEKSGQLGSNLLDFWKKLGGIYEIKNNSGDKHLVIFYWKDRD